MSYKLGQGHTDQPPTQPQLSFPSDGKTIFDTSRKLSWEASSDPEGNSITYDVFLDKSEEPIKKVADSISKTNYDIFGLEKAYTYYWKVVAYDSNGNKSESLIWNFTPKKVITFEDPNLEEVIRNKINKTSGDIYKSDVINIFELKADDHNISSIEGIQHLENLEKLDLGKSFTSNNISNISLLAKLTNLIGLSLAENQVSDITPLSNLTNLEALALHNNPIGEISPLSNLTNLKYLYLENTQINSIDSLDNMNDMLKLDIRKNTISDIKPLANFTNLNYLLMQGNEITDISSLVENSGIDQGDRVDLSNNYLDLTDGSEDMDDINTLLNREVDLNYKPQN